MLFRKKMPKSCTLCLRSTILSDTEVLCTKHGIRPVESYCRKFKYDPCKRVPPRPKAPDFTRYEQDDFSL